MAKPNQLSEGQLIRSRDGKLIGVFTGHSRPCALEGCRGVRLRVKWPDGKYTWPCSQGMGTPTFGPTKGQLEIN